MRTTFEGQDLRPLAGHANGSAVIHLDISDPKRVNLVVGPKDANRSDPSFRLHVDQVDPDDFTVVIKPGPCSAVHPAALPRS